MTLRRRGTLRPKGTGFHGLPSRWLDAAQLRNALDAERQRLKMTRAGLEPLPHHWLKHGTHDAGVAGRDAGLRCAAVRAELWN
jgi:hypothetical protein